MDQTFYSESVVKEFLVQNGPLFAQIMDDEPEIMRLEDGRKYQLIYSEYIQDKPLQAAYKEFFEQRSIAQSRQYGSYKYESAVIGELDSLIRKFGWKSFILALIELCNRRKLNAYDENTRGIWVRIRDKISVINKSVSYN